MSNWGVYLPSIVSGDVLESEWIDPLLSPQMNDLKVILLLEDDAADQYIIEKELQGRFHNPIQSLSTSQQFMDYLEGRGDNSNRKSHPFPVLLLIDLKLADDSGFTVLDWCKTHPDLRIRALPVAVVTQLTEIGTANRAYALGADTFFPKPLTLEDFENWISRFPRLKLISRPPKQLIEASTP